jgi:hypothetical protein
LMALGTEREDLEDKGSTSSARHSSISTVSSSGSVHSRGSQQSGGSRGRKRALPGGQGGGEGGGGAMEGCAQAGSGEDAMLCWLKTALRKAVQDVLIEEGVEEGREEGGEGGAKRREEWASLLATVRVQRLPSSRKPSNTRPGDVEAWPLPSASGSSRREHNGTSALVAPTQPREKQKPRSGAYASPTALPLAAALRRRRGQSGGRVLSFEKLHPPVPEPAVSPAGLAARLRTRLMASPGPLEEGSWSLEDVQVAPNGFLNFFVNRRKERDGEKKGAGADAASPLTEAGSEGMAQAGVAECEKGESTGSSSRRSEGAEAEGRRAGTTNPRLRGSKEGREGGREGGGDKEEATGGMRRGVCRWMWRGTMRVRWTGE